MRFGHVAVRVKDIDTMLKYYVEGWGFKEAFRILNDDGTVRIVFLHISEGQYLELCLGGDERAPFDDQKTLGHRHTSFTVEDIAQTKKEMESRGVVFDSEILTMRDNNLTCFLFDPEGNKLEITQIMENSPHAKFERENV